VGVGLLAGLLVWHLTHQPKSVATAVARGKVVRAPAFALPRLGAPGKLSLVSLRGKVVALNFWQSSCGPCKQEMPRLEAAARRWAGKGVVVVGVDMLDTRGAGEAFRKRYGATYPMVFDQVADTAAPYGVWNTPETLFVNPRGFIVKRILGPVSSDGFDAAVRTALAA
jgi:thiol-disulfide isomerase/thioredoxin